MPWFDDQCRNALASSRRLIFSGPVIALNWGQFVRCQVRANETESGAEHQFSDRNRDVCMNVHSPQNWWSTLKFVVFGSSSSLPPLLVRVVDWCASWLVRLICCWIIMTASSPGRLLISHSLHPSPSLTTFAFSSSEVRRLLLDLDPYGGTDPLGLFPLFLKRTADVMAPCLSVVFWWLVRLNSLSACWRQANVTKFRKVHRPPLLPITNRFP